jgi:YVTN family beta-propeller protein
MGLAMSSFTIYLRSGAARLALAAAVTAGVGGCARSCGSSARSGPPTLFVTDEEVGTVIVVDPARAAVLTRIAVGKRPRGLVLSPDGQRLYVALSGSPRSGPGGGEADAGPPDRNADGIAVIDVAKRAVIKTLPGGTDPEALDISPDGRTLFVSNEDAAQLSVIDLSSGTVRGVVGVGHEPEGVTVRPDGKVVFVTSEQDNEVTAVDTTTLGVVGHIATAMRPRSVVFTRDGSTGFVADEFAHKVTIIDAIGFAVQAEVTITLNSPRFTGPRPMGLALSPDDKTLYVTTGRGGSLAVIDVAERKQTRSFDGVGNRPWGVTTSADGAFAYTANGTSHDVSIINVATGNVDRRVTTGGLPWGIVISRAR